MARALMIQGTGSDVGKSLIVAALARAYADRGLAVRPFKPQNMSNNAAVTADGGEIGRAQALQARAARVAPTVHMNPVLLKPQGMVGAQVVVRGAVTGNASARAYQAMKPGLMTAVLDSFAVLAEGADLVLVEGAGSAAEINLRAADIANMGFARAAGVPVVIVGDIDRGGVIAQIVGTRAVIDPADAATVAGFIVNRFRGDPALFTAGMEAIAARTGWRALGLVPHAPEAAHLPPEDGMALSRAGFATAAGEAGAPVVAVVVLPAIANFDDLDPLLAEPSVRVVAVRPGESIPHDAALVVLPGSKATIADLAALKAAGLHHDLAVHLRRGGRVLGVCGGYQMLGRSVADPAGVEGPPGVAEGLGFLAVDTVLTGDKRLVRVAGEAVPSGVPLSGYEMHVGVTTGPDTARPFARLAGEAYTVHAGGARADGARADGARADGARADGARSADGRVAGTYLHGLFAHDRQRAHILGTIGAAASVAFEARVEAALDALAAHVAAHVDLDLLLSLAAPVAGGTSQRGRR